MIRAFSLNKIFISLLILGLSFSFTSLKAQVDDIEASGLVKDERSNKLLSNVLVTKERDGKVMDSVRTGVNGRFILKLDFGYDYNIRLSKNGYVSKFININSENVPDENQVGGFGFDLNVNLFEEVEGINFDILKQPIGKAKFEEASGEIAFDFEYTKSIQARINELRRELAKKYKEEEEKLLADQKAAEAEAAKQAKFDALVQEGDGLMSNANYMNAIFKYSEALDLIPDVPSVVAKLDKAKKALEDKQANEEENAKYTALIEDANKLLGKENFNDAKAKYQEASAVKPAEQFPKDKIKEIDAKLAEIAQKNAIEKQYATAIEEGDIAFKAKNYQASISSYKKALGIKKGEKYPTDQISLAEKNIAELEAEKARDENYKKAIAEADAAFSSKKYQDAIKAYNNALSIKANEQYPKDKIAEANKAIADAQAKAELDENYKNIIADADKKFSGEKWQEAKAAYNEALKLKKEDYPSKQIVAIDAKLAEIAAKNEAEKAYNDAITKADNLFKENKLTDAVAQYQAALSIKANESYPKDQIAKANEQLKAQAEKEALDKKYNDLIAAADASFNNKKYQEAIATYNQALSVKSKESYPKDQISKAEKALSVLADEAEKRKAYDALVAQGDAALAAKKYDDAIGEYQDALKMYPDEAYPKEQITKANAELKAIADAEATRKQYDVVIKEADGLLKKKSYKEAIASYQKASGLLPSEQYPKDKISEAQNALNALADQKALNEEYTNTLAEADKLFADKKLEDAKAKYQSASGLKPTEKYPVDQMKKVDEALAEIAAQNAIDEKYKNLIASADEKFENKKYSEAINEYNAALAVKSKETYPKTKITEAQAALKSLASAQELKKEYDNAIAKGDNLFGQKDYKGALGAYQNAKSLIPEEKLADEKIAATNAKIAEQETLAENQRKYQEKLAAADKLFLESNWKQSIVIYNEALDILPNESYPKEKIEDAQSKLDALANEKERIDKAYDAAIKYADELFSDENYINSITAYDNALNLKPNEQYPKDQIAKANKLIDEAEALAAKKKAEELLAQSTEVPKEEEKKETTVVSFTDITTFGDNDELKEKAKEEARDANVEEAKPEENKPKIPISTVPPEDLDKYRVLLGENYPEGVTKETIKEGNKTFYRTVIVENKLGDEYLKVDARFGVFFFKNGLTIKASEYNSGVSN